MKNLKTKKFIDKCIKIHNNKYDYSLVEYINNVIKVKIICPEHGIFEQSPVKHINRKQTCPKCSGHYMDTELLIKKANIIHNNEYDYSQVKYIDSITKIKIICPIHGVFEQTPNNHLSNKKCYLCNGTPKKTNIIFINDANKIHNNKYDYSLVNYISNNVKVKINCDKHGTFEQTPQSHLNGSGCPLCKESKGEISIRDYLIENKINFIRQKRFDDCRNILPLPFDFYLPDFNTCIEYNGRQHYVPISIWGNINELNNIKLRDKIKYDYCYNNNIKLIIIKYDEIILDKLNIIFR